MRAKYHDHSSHTGLQQMPRSHRHSHRHKTERRTAVACWPLFHAPSSSSRLSDSLSEALLALTGSWGGRRREARRLALVHAVRWSKTNVLTFAARVPSSSASRAQQPRAMRAASTRTASSLIALSVSFVRWYHKAVSPSCLSCSAS